MNKADDMLFNSCHRSIVKSFEKMTFTYPFGIRKNGNRNERSCMRSPVDVFQLAFFRCSG